MSRTGGAANVALEGGDVVIAFPVARALILPATQFRSTPVINSIETLRGEGRFEQYAKSLEGRRDEVVLCPVGTWMPIALAGAHYQACDRLGLSIQEQVAMGRAAAERASTGWLATFLTFARGGAGLTPWSLLNHLDRLWKRIADGGAVAVYRLGPKEARVEYVGCELFDIPYYRNGSRGMLDALGGMLSERHHTHELPRRARGEATYRLQWV